MAAVTAAMAVHSFLGNLQAEHDTFALAMMLNTAVLSKLYISYNSTNTKLFVIYAAHVREG